jgi:hypothetical protein
MQTKWSDHTPKSECADFFVYRFVKKSDHGDWTMEVKPWKKAWSDFMVCGVNGPQEKEVCMM